MKIKRSIIAFLLTLAAANAAFSQTGGIAGNVVDTAGASVAGATVTLRNTKSGAEVSTVTDSEGNFSFARAAIEGDSQQLRAYGSQVFVTESKSFDGPSIARPSIPFLRQQHRP